MLDERQSLDIVMARRIGLGLSRVSRFQKNFRFAGDNPLMIFQRVRIVSIFGLSLLAAPVTPGIPQTQRSKIDQATGVKGTFVFYDALFAECQRRVGGGQ